MSVRRARVTRRRSRNGITLDSKRPTLANSGQASRLRDRYVLHELLGRGASAEVFRAWDQDRAQIVALKRLLRSPVDGDAAPAERLAHEYYALSELAHPSIVRVFDYGMDGEHPYYTLEYVEGSDLRALAPLPWPKVCQVLYDLASALSMLHVRRRVHRDVTASNVRMSAESGRAKLIDFGLMAPMGVIKHVAGTAPFLAPETVQLQFVDGRADLFALGALGYFALTGRHAYPASRVEQLRDRWRSVPFPLARLAPDAPAALRDLLMQLLMLDRSARPASAAEVMERLRVYVPEARAKEHSTGVAQAYLVSPPLVGREADLLHVRRAVICATAGSGSRLVVLGDPGAGRSRFLDACVLEGKLAGATVVRADSADAFGGEYGVLRSIINQLLASAPEASARLGKGHQVLRHLFARPAPENAPEQQVEQQHTAQMVAVRDAMLAFIRALSRDRTLLFAIDDLPRIDASSAAILAALAHEVEVRRTVLVVTAAAEPGPGTHVTEWLTGVGELLLLQPFSPEQTLRLLESLFGQSVEAETLAVRVHALTGGNPRACMRLAQHMVDRGLCSYRGGRWVMPSTVEAVDLPGDMRAVLQARLLSLPRVARDLLLHLALVDGGLGLDPLLGLPLSVSVAEIHSAIDGLVAGEFVAMASHRYCVAGGDVRALLLALTTADEVADAHCHLAHICVDDPTLAKREVLHRLRGGDSAGAVDKLVRYLRDHPLWLEDSLEHNHALLSGVMAEAMRLGRPDADMIVLELSYLGLACSLRVDGYREPLARLGRRLTRACGLDLLAAMEEAEGETPSERVERALFAAQQRFAAEGGAALTLAPGEALLTASTTVRWAAALAATLMDPSLLDLLPDIGAYACFSPLLALSMCPVRVARLGAVGNYEAAYAVLERFYDQTGQLGDYGIDPELVTLARSNVLFGKALVAARMGREGALEAADELERYPEQQMNAWILRMSAHLRKGDLVAANQCRRRVELLRTERRPPQVFEGFALLLEAEHYLFTADVVAMGQILPRIEHMAQVHPPFSRWADFMHGAYALLQGNVTLAEARMEKLAVSMAYGSHVVRFYAQSVLLHVLFLQNRHDEVCLRGREYLEEHSTVCGWLFRVHPMTVWAVSMARLGNSEEAVALFDSAFEHVARHGATWFTRCVLHQRRAMVACFMRDRAAFESHTEAFVELLRGGAVAVLSLGHTQLIAIAQEQGLTVPARLLLRSHEDITAADEANRLLAEVHELVAPDDSVYEQWLSLLLLRHGLASGTMWLLPPDGSPPSLLGACGGQDIDVLGLGQRLHAHVKTRTALEDEQDDDTGSTADVACQLRFGQKCFAVCFLSPLSPRHEPVVVALLAATAPVPPQWELWGALGEAVLREWRSDCEGIVLRA